MGTGGRVCLSAFLAKAVILGKAFMDADEAIRSQMDCQHMDIVGGHGTSDPYFFFFF